MAETIDLDGLRQRLAKLGVATQLAAGAVVPDIKPSPRSPKPQNVKQAKSGAGESKQKKQVAELLSRLDNVESGIRVQETLASLGAQIAGAGAAAVGTGGPERSVSPGANRPKKLKANKAVRAAAAAAGAVRASISAPAGGAGGMPASGTAGVVGRSGDLLKGVPPTTPLASVLHQYKEAEVCWAHDKTQLRREVDDARRRAAKAEVEARRLGKLAEHRAMDIKALKTALKNRDAQLDAANERIQQLEALLARTTEEAGARAAGLAAERDDCKALLLATLQRLEAVDEVVHRADVSSTMMQEKMKALEEERLRALEAAARARAEVAELTESRRKLQWQSKLLEKMSEVQLRHNQRKTEAIKKLLESQNQGGGMDAMSMLSGFGGSDLGLDAAAAAAADDLDGDTLSELARRAGITLPV